MSPAESLLASFPPRVRMQSSALNGARAVVEALWAEVRIGWHSREFNLNLHRSAPVLQE